MLVDRCFTVRPSLGKSEYPLCRHSLPTIKTNLINICDTKNKSGMEQITGIVLVGSNIRHVFLVLVVEVTLGTG